MKRAKRPSVERERCLACEAITAWVPVRGNVFRCEGCGMRFPCAHLCSHLDCRLHRGDSLEYVNARGGKS